MGRENWRSSHAVLITSQKPCLGVKGTVREGYHKGMKGGKKKRLSLARECLYIFNGSLKCYMEDVWILHLVIFASVLIQKGWWGECPHDPVTGGTGSQTSRPVILIKSSWREGNKCVTLGSAFKSTYMYFSCRFYCLIPSWEEGLCTIKQADPDNSFNWVDRSTIPTSSNWTDWSRHLIADPC